MKRMWIGIGILTALLALGLYTMWLTDHRLSEVAYQLQKAAAEENWETAEQLSRQAKQQWEDNWFFSAALADHTDIDEIDGVFARLEVYRRYENTAAHAATCAWLSEAVTDLEENHRLTWWNLL